MTRLDIDELTVGGTVLNVSAWLVMDRVGGFNEWGIRGALMAPVEPPDGEATITAEGRTFSGRVQLREYQARLDYLGVGKLDGASDEDYEA